MGALAGGGTPGGHVLVAARLVLQTGTVAVLVPVETGIGCAKSKPQTQEAFFISRRDKHAEIKARIDLDILNMQS